jgi:hypothetical protein
MPIKTIELNLNICLLKMTKYLNLSPSDDEDFVTVDFDSNTFRLFRPS